MISTEETSHGTRRYICPELLRTVKVGETWSLDYAARCVPFKPTDALVAFDGCSTYPTCGICYRWKRESDGRVFIYTEEQCCRLIYTLTPNAAAHA